MSKRLVTWHTNKEIVVVRPTERLASLACEAGFEVSAARTPPGYFVVDAPSAKVPLEEEPFIPAQARHEIKQGWFSRVFESELSEMGLPVELWPDTSSIEAFDAFLLVEYHPLIADFGEHPLKTLQV